MFPTRTVIQAFARIPEEGHERGSRPHIFEDFETAVVPPPLELAPQVVPSQVPAAVRVPPVRASHAAAR